MTFATSVLALAGTFVAVWMSVAIESGEVSATPQVASADEAPATSSPASDAYTLVGPRHFLRGVEARSGDGLVHVVVEIPTGSVDKWEVDKTDGSLRWEFKNGKPRQVRYLGYPGNYGMIPRTLLPKDAGGDGDPLDVIVLGPAVERGTVIEARLMGVLRLLDDGEQDDKLLAVMAGTALADAADLEQLQEQFPGVTQIVETWFTHYKGPDAIETLGYLDAAAAVKVLEAAMQAFEAQRDGS